MLILFRSDTRPPAEIFKDGFATRMPLNPEDKITPLGPFESNTFLTIAFSATLEATPWFPVASDDIQTWVYAVAVDDTQDSTQYLDLHTLSLSLDNRDDLAFRLPFHEFPKEKNVIRVAPENVVCAFPVQRNMKMIDFLVGQVPGCETFEIQSAAMMNPTANTIFHNNPPMKKNLDEMLKKYNAKVKQEIDVAQPHPKHPAQLKKAKSHNAFFVMKRFEPLEEYKPTQLSARTHTLESTKAFFKTATLQNSSGLLFSSEAQICKQNSLFYTAVTESNLFDEKIGLESKEIEKVRLNARKEFVARLDIPENMLKSVFGEEVSEPAPPPLKAAKLG